MTGPGFMQQVLTGLCMKKQGREFILNIITRKRTPEPIAENDLFKGFFQLVKG